MAIRWALSASKHHIEHEDALNAILNSTYWLPEFDDPKVAGGRPPHLFIGPSRDGTILLEVMAEVSPPDDIFVFHVMPARRKIIDIAERRAR